MEGAIIKAIDATFKWLKAIGSGILAVMGAMGEDFGGFADTADRIDDAARATLEVVKGDAIRYQITTATEKFRIIGGISEK